jgi:acylphosphatase
MKAEAKHVVVHGRVQGVGFRYFVQRAGTRLGLVGNVRNLDDGSVEIVVEGDGGIIGDFLKEVGRGPSLSRVERLDVRETPPTGRYSTFQVEGW